MGLRDFPRALLVPPDICWALVWRVFRRNLLIFRKTWKANLVFNIIDPVFYLWAMGIGLGGFVSRVQGLTYLEFLAPALVASSAMFASAYEMTYGSYTRMAVQKSFQGMVATPVSLDDVVCGELLYGTFKGVLYGSVFLCVVAAFGVVRSAWALAVPVPLLLTVGVISVLSLVWTSIAPGFDSFEYFFTLFITPMFFFSGIFFPLDVLPEAVRRLAWFMPLYHAVEAVRPLVLGRVTPAVAGHLAWLAAFLLLSARLPLLMIRRRLIQ
ncbi:MAG: ABC transporter permease [Syntrophomonadaceae bacterium]|nr:ABC transporter permease [Syntrophomonadaceae bacterium]